MKSISDTAFLVRRRTIWNSGGTGLALFLGLAVAVVTVRGVPTSVLSSANEANAHHGSDVTKSHQPQQSRSSATSNPIEGKNQISVPQKRGVNPLLYNDLDYSGNSIPHGGMWDDINGPPLTSSSATSAARVPLTAIYADPGSDSRVRNYDLLASLLDTPPAQTFYGDPITPSVNYPYVYGLGYGDRSKRMANSAQRNTLQSLRLKRSPSKLTPADALSLLALLESRDPYPAMSDYFPLMPANGPNDVLPYSPNSVYQDIPLSLALAQLGSRSGGGGGMHASRNVAQLAPYSDNEGEWMSTWTEPAVDYLGFPMDVDTLSRMDHHDTKPSKNGFPQQKRFMITKKKRSVSFNNDDCDKSENKKNCLLRKYGQLAAAKVATA